MTDQSSKLASQPALINRAISNFMKDVHTAMPGIVQSFDPETQLAVVQPAIRRVFKTTEENKEILVPREIPPLINVQVQFFKSGGFMLTTPVNSGDECLLIFCERDISNWKKNGGVQSPKSRRFHDLSDAIAIVGISSQPNAIQNFNNERIEMRNSVGDSRIYIDGDGTCAMSTMNEQNFVVAFPSGTCGFQNQHGAAFLAGGDGNITVQSADEVNVSANTVNINAGEVNLGSGGNAIAREGDEITVEITSGSSAGVYNGTITSGSSNNTSN